MKLMSTLMMALMAGVLFGGTAAASGLQYDIKDERNCTDRYVSQGEEIDFKVRVDGSQDGSMIVISTTNISAKLYQDGQDVSDLLEPYLNADTAIQGVFAYVDTAGDYRLVTASSGQGSVCVAKPS